tara:strand:+ start:1402 stop:2799 length:1398 start_codon:yes stop_codon:yes gene_type:complete
MIKNIATTRYVLVAIIVLSFVGIVYFVTKDKRTCAEKGEENDPRKGESGCVEKCRTKTPQNDPFRCVSEKLCKNRDYNGIVKCADCEKGEVAVEKNTGEYKCQQECISTDDCPSNQKCQPVSSKEDTTPPQYCGTATYTCVLDPEQDIMDGKKILVKRGDRGKKCVPSPVGTSLSECLLSGNSITTGDDKSCTCNHKKGYALNSQNTACDTVACTEDGINGWGALGTNNIKSTAFNPNVKDEIDGTCYALDSDGLLVNPENDTSECKSAVNKPACIKLNSDGWKCKWLPGVSCDRIPIPMKACGFAEDCGDICPKEVDKNFWKKKCQCQSSYDGNICCAATQRNVHGDNMYCQSYPYTDLIGITDHATYFIPNCPSQFESDTDRLGTDIIHQKLSKQQVCKNFYNNGKEKSNKEVGGFNPVTKYNGICIPDESEGAGFPVDRCSRTNERCVIPSTRNPNPPPTKC